MNFLFRSQKENSFSQIQFTPYLHNSTQDEAASLHGDAVLSICRKSLTGNFIEKENDL